MNFKKLSVAMLVMGLLLGLAACSQQRASQPSVKENVERQFEQAGLKDVNIDEDRDKGVITLKGEVQSQEMKERAEEIAKSAAGDRMVVANEIGVRPEGMEREAGKVDSHLDEAIENDLKAALIANKLDDKVRFEVKNGVVTLKGDARSMEQRKAVEDLAAKTPNVQQVVNEIEVKQAKGNR